MLEKDLITCQQAAAILGRSPSTISRALTQGRLSYGDTKRKLIYRPGLKQRFVHSTRRKADAPQVVVREERIALSPEPQPIAKDYWGRLADKLNFVLEGAPAYWAMALAQLSLPVIRSLFFLLLFGALGAPPVAVEDVVHQKCLQAADYKGYVELMAASGSGIAALKKELKLLPSRLEATSMGDFY